MCAAYGEHLERGEHRRSVLVRQALLRQHDAAVQVASQFADLRAASKASETTVAGEEEERADALHAVRYPQVAG